MKLTDAIGNRVLDHLDKLELPVEKALIKNHVSPADFGIWLEQNQEAKDRYTEIRSRVPKREA